ncbi:hypothetical protein [Saccharibacillus brassicae]|uniref:Uncharacterized protein n=1 Tax=Saccharibacillus brassicae TaxID=2583377 RepID=A0A4Y6UV67_SACBS|nr:hypothetical protein [Saccharibacillus brassicae]QDH21622.1 hypothetical protein FFV09_12670 [Saccharibacillus brassicae]
MKEGVHIFRMELTVKEFTAGNKIDESLLNPDLELDSDTAVFIRMCEIFGISARVSFFVSGFGQKRWPVDCKTDLATVIEEVPYILEKVNNGDFFFELDFYEQGIERTLIFEEEDNKVQITCSSRTDWIPDPNNVRMDKSEVLRMFENFYNSFWECSYVLCSELAEHPLLKNLKNN